MAEQQSYPAVHPFIPPNDHSVRLEDSRAKRSQDYAFPLDPELLVLASSGDGMARRPEEQDVIHDTTSTGKRRHYGPPEQSLSQEHVVVAEPMASISTTTEASAKDMTSTTAIPVLPPERPQRSALARKHWPRNTPRLKHANMAQTMPELSCILVKRNIRRRSDQLVPLGATERT